MQVNLNLLISAIAYDCNATAGPYTGSGLGGGGKTAPGIPKSDSVPGLEIEHSNYFLIALHYLSDFNPDHDVQSILDTTGGGGGYEAT